MPKNDTTHAKNTALRKSPENKPKFDMYTAFLKSQLGLKAQKEYYFHPTRQWRFDYCIPDKKIAIEVEGGVFKKRTYTDKRTGEQITTTGGRHNSSTGFLKDMEKYNAAASLGWKVFRTTPQDMYSLKFLELLAP